MSTITTVNANDYQDDSRAVINDNFTTLNNEKVGKAGDTMTGALAFSGTGHAGIRVNNLTTAQRNALTAAAGMLIYNTTLACFEKYENGAWVSSATAPSMTTTVRDTLTAVNGMTIYNTTTSTYQVYQAGAWLDFVTPKFGGTGTDGALTYSSGTHDIALGGVQVFIKNYSSISITGTAKITFSGPHANGTTIIFKCSGDVTLTSSQAPMIDASGMGSAATTDGYSFSLLKTNLGADTVNNVYNSVGAAGAVATINPAGFIASQFSGKYPQVVPGAGGGSSVGIAGGGGGGSIKSAGTVGSSGANSGYSGSSGTGSRGGGALIIECKGALNFTTTSGISVAGVTGVSASGGINAGGGGGGGGGVVVIIYNTVTASTGTITVSGGTGGSPTTTGGAGGNGGNGYSLVAQNTEYV